MADNKIILDRPNYFARVVRNHAAKKGFAAALAGLAVALVMEGLWPSQQ